MAGQIGPVVLAEHGEDTVRQLGGGGEFRAHEGGDLGLEGGGAADLDHHLAHALEAHDLPPDEEGVALAEHRGEIFLDLPQGRAAAGLLVAHLHLVGIHDGADVHADARGRARVAQLPLAIRALHQPLPLVIGAERVAPGGREIEAAVEAVPRQVGIGARGADFCKQLVGMERPGGGPDQDVLAQHVERAGVVGVTVKLPGAHGLQRGGAFDHLEAVGGHDQRL